MELVSAQLDRRHSHNISSRGQKLILIFIVAGIISLAQLSSIIVVRSVDMLFLTHGGVCPWGHLTGWWRDSSGRPAARGPLLTHIDSL